MPGPDIAAMAVFIALVGLIYWAGTQFFSGTRARKTTSTATATSFGRREGPPPAPVRSGPAPPKTARPNSARPNLKDTAQQLDAVAAASFQTQRLMNHSEFDAFRTIEKEVAAARKGYRVFAQVNLGEIMESQNDDAYKSAFHSINAKRVDILITNGGGWPALAIEYQGEGHYQGDAEGRDAVKKEALRKAGIGYLEIFPDDTADQIRARVREQLGWSTASPTQPKLSRPANAGRPVEA
jgi:Protein of unknown function (DUF2726)